MIGTKLYWVSGPWPGNLALAARPRGGDWLEDEMTSWRRDGIDTVFSLLTVEEERELQITAERAEAQAHGMTFLSFPIPDRQVPSSQSNFSRAVDQLDRELSGGRNVVLHCRQGLGRTGLIAACALVNRGFDPETAVNRLSAARGTTVPETQEQRRWIDHFSESLAATK